MEHIKQGTAVGSSYVITSSLCSLEKWTLAEFKKRHNEFVDELVNEWKLEDGKKQQKAGSKAKKKKPRN